MATAADGDAQSDHVLAAVLAREAGERLRAARADDPGSGVGVRGDRASHELLVARLAEARPDDAVLSEEGRDDRSRLDARRVWIVDPLDGTREYAEGRDDWAVHVALAVDGELVAGAVALPDREMVLATDPAPPPPPPREGRLRIVTSRTRFPAITDIVAEALDAEVVPMGSAGAKAMAVVLGEVDVYAHAGGIHEWDTAAPVVVAQAAGLHVSCLDGSPLRYNQPDPYQLELLICRPELADRCLAAAAGTSW